MAAMAQVSALPCVPMAASHKQHRSSPITDEIKELFYTFWKEKTRVSPNKKDVGQKRVGRKSYMKHPVHLLDKSQVEYLP